VIGHGGLVVSGAIAWAVAAMGVPVAEAKVEMKDVAFSPAEIHVKAGDTVTWHDADEGLKHTVTAVDKSFDSSPQCGSGAPGPGGCMGKGDTFTALFARPGRFPYYCRIHGGPGGDGMSGVVVVE
jgi:plastocyanin